MELGVSVPVWAFAAAAVVVVLPQGREAALKVMSGFWILVVDFQAHGRAHLSMEGLPAETARSEVEHCIDVRIEGQFVGMLSRELGRADRVGRGMGREARAAHRDRRRPRRGALHGALEAP